MKNESKRGLPDFCGVNEKGVSQTSGLRPCGIPTNIRKLTDVKWIPESRPEEAQGKFKGAYDRPVPWVWHAGREALSPRCVPHAFKPPRHLFLPRLAVHYTSSM